MKFWKSSGSALTLPLHHGLKRRWNFVLSFFPTTCPSGLTINTTRWYSPMAASAGLYTVTTDSFWPCCWWNHQTPGAPRDSWTLMVTLSLLPERKETRSSVVVVNELTVSQAQESVRSSGRGGTSGRWSEPTEVQQQLQVMFGRQRVSVLQRYGEGLSPADNQTLPVNLPGAVGQVVFVTPNINVVDKSWKKKKTHTHKKGCERKWSFLKFLSVEV